MIHFIPRSAYVEYLLGMVEKSIADSTSLADTSGRRVGGGGREKEVEGGWNRSVSGAR